MLFVIPPILIFSSTLLIHKWREWNLPVDEKLDREVSVKVGPKAIDCGFVPDVNALDQRSDVDACVVAAFKTKKTFRARYQKQFPDNQTETYWMFGTMKNDICAMRRSGSVITGAIISRAPKVIKVNGQERLVCPEMPE
jgi:hypothetical protein